MSPVHLILVSIPVLFVVYAVFGVALKLYAWEDQTKNSNNKAPRTLEAPQLSFTILVPARHEEAIVQDTIDGLVDLIYPPHLLQVLIIVEDRDSGTVAKVCEKLSALRSKGVSHIRLLTFSGGPINKPHSLNVGLREAQNDVVVVMDAEDQINPNLLQVVNTILVREDIVGVQGGVQLMNCADHWFSALNVLEYFFWFRSRMHFHASLGTILFGGNTIFIRRPFLEQLGGWDEHCLTEDADLGIRVGTMGFPLRVFYDQRFVTREETPHTVWEFVKQRTRWHQGFLQLLIKRDWMRLPTPSQRLLTCYTLMSPIVQLLMVLYIPFSFLLSSWFGAPVWIAMLMILPLYSLLADLFISLAGLSQFASDFGHKSSVALVLMTTFAYYPYQCLLSFSTVRALWRQSRGVNTWEKTTHVGAHRRVKTVS